MLAKLSKENKSKKREVDRTKPHLSIGTIGHVDAGKSTLSSAIVRLQNSKNLADLEEYDEIDKAPEEKRRGITINIKHIKFETTERHYTLIDCPGHVDFLKNMILGASQMDGAILVVSSDGVQQQTVEHLKLCRTLGVEHLVVLINDKLEKIKTGDEEEEKKFEQEKEGLFMVVEDELEACSYDSHNVPIVFFSALKALHTLEGKIKESEKEEGKIAVEKLEELIKIIDQSIPLPVREPEKPFLMYIESKYRVTGHGTIVAGKVEQGILKEGDSVQIVGLGKPKKILVVRSMEMHGEIIKDYARPGDDVGISLRGGLDFEDVQKGQVLGASTLILEPSDNFLVDAYIFSKDEGRTTPFESGYKPQFFIHTANITGEVILPPGVKIEPEEGEKRVSFRVKLISPIFVRERDKFIMRESKKTVGMGFITRILKSEDEVYASEGEEETLRS